MVGLMARHRMDAGDLDLGLLRTFLTLVSSGSLGKTGPAIGKTQSAVSQQMLRLEKIVGQKLFTRGRDGIALTHHVELREAYSKRAVEFNPRLCRWYCSRGLVPGRTRCCILYAAAGANGELHSKARAWMPFLLLQNRVSALSRYAHNRWR